MSAETFLSAAPKAELHLHFQGAIRPETLLELARRHGIDVPAQDVAGLREWFRFRDFAHFVEVYALLRACLVEPADYELVTGSELGLLDSAFGLKMEDIQRIVRNAFEARFADALSS